MIKHIIVLLLTTFLIASTCLADDVKDADLAGSWYPASEAALKGMLQGYLTVAKPEEVNGKIFAIITPHAGYQYSGPIAAYAYKAVQGKSINTIILVGFSHKELFEGISVFNNGSFRTPLGKIEVDSALASAIMAENKRFVYEPRLFQDENSIEMQIPLIQMALGKTRIVPIVFGTQLYADAEILADALAKVTAGRDDILVIASTDMSHYHPYDEANLMDNRTINLLKDMKTRDLYEEAAIGRCELCGIMPVTATLLAAEKLGFGDIKILKYANSGDTSGDRRRVVGYVSAVVYKSDEIKREAVVQKEDEKLLNDAQRKRLLEIARESIKNYVMNGKRKKLSEADPVLNQPMGAFVTLHEKGQLRGCIGNMVGQGPLCQTIADMAIEAATGDPRFEPLSPKEIDSVDIEISVLSPMKRIYNSDEIKIPGHGVLVRRGFRSGVYLPQVATETGWNKEEFLTSLCGQKAGLDPDAWKDPATELYIFSAEVFGEKEAE